jgi:PAS domain S-box-containing protein
MWLFALVSYWAEVIQINHFRGVSASVAYLVLINPPTLWILKRATQKISFKYISLLINLLEVIGYTAIIYFLGGVETTYLVLLYGALITYVGIVATRSLPFVVASFCSICFSLVVVLEHFGFLPSQNIMPNFYCPWKIQIALLSAAIGLLFVNAFIASYTANLLKRNREKIRQQAFTNEQLQKAIAERERAEKALREREERYRTLLETMEEGYFEVDLKGNFTFVNDGMCKITGFPKDKLIGMNNREYMDKEVARKVYEVFNQVYNTGEPIKMFEWEIIIKDSKRAVHESSVYLIRNAQGERIGFRGIARDVTERKKVEGALQSAHRRLQDIVEFLPDPTFVVDKDRKVIAWNRAIEEMTGINKNDIIGQGDSAYALPFYGKKSPMLIDLIFPENQEAAGLFPGLQKKEGKLYLEGAFPSVFSGKGAFLWAVASPLLDSAGNLAGAIQSLRDITDQKSANARLMQSEKMASIGQLAAGVAHEINNPTAFVSSNLGTLGQYITDLISLIHQHQEFMAAWQADMKHEELSAKMEQILALEKQVKVDYVLDDVSSLIKESQEGTERIKKIVMDLKDFAHPGDDQLKPADINKNLDSTLNVVWNELKYKATVRREYGAIPPIPCIPQQLNQVFLNLLVNAAQAIPEKGEICIRTQSENGYVEIQISDTGEGISPENLPRIFDPFFTTKAVGQGTGLGLHVAYSIVKRHNGTIDVKSEVGKGTNFTVRLPVGS